MDEIKKENGVWRKVLREYQELEEAILFITNPMQAPLLTFGTAPLPPSQTVSQPISPAGRPISIGLRKGSMIAASLPVSIHKQLLFSDDSVSSSFSPSFLN